MIGSALVNIRATARQGGPSGRAARILWLHCTDRWYFGDFLRHSVWLRSLIQENPGATIDLASHPDYLALYADGRFGQLLDVRDPPNPCDPYDLVVAPGPFEIDPDSIMSNGVLAPSGSTSLITWDRGWSLRPHGASAIRGNKDDLNYFRAAHPGSASEKPLQLWNDEVSLPGWLPPLFTSQERACVEEALARRFSGDAPVIVYNPTASNVFTRDTDVPKEVGNSLIAREHVVVLSRLIDLFPGHQFLVAAALKDGDDVNAEMISAVCTGADSPRVASLFDLEHRDFHGLRGFAGLLASPRICSSVGSGTGTNTHLAAVLDVPSLSVERGADAAMLKNWSSNGFQMGSFRWRNPAVCAAVHTLDWSNRNDAALEEVALSFLAHHSLHHGDTRSTLFADLRSVTPPIVRFHESWPEQPLAATTAAREVLALLRSPARRYYEDFSDEATYLSFRYGLRPQGLATVTEAISSGDDEVRRTGLQLFQDSNLHKLATHLYRVLRPADGAGDKRTTGHLVAHR
ncbi:hypothetical protein [Kineosporia babensis]|uniref:Uncharacterized protein n=1 Tax=Kineosporia babensis TaxID=499548 RepID=A0A9X1NL18_9ACTN|nr:hypothetical protein [Kineosporia babensis]MCD5316133.1 hypothetical protein [Kineosporia babensis]